MSTLTKKAILTALVEGAITELMVKTKADNVYIDDSTTVAAKLAELVTAVNLRAKSTDVTTEIETAINGLIDDAPDTYNTLKEIATYITEHEDVVDTLNAAIGSKADASTVTALQATVNALGTLAKKNKVSESDLDDALVAKVNAAAEGNHSHSNQTVLDGISAAKVTEWDSKGTVFVSSTEPTELAAGDLFIKLVD